MKHSTSVYAAVLAIACAATARAEVVNIDAAVYGSPFSGYPQVLVPVTPGHYRATLVNPSITSAALFTAWSYAFGWPGTWRTQYRFRFGDGSTKTGGATPETNDAQSAFDATSNKTLEFDVAESQTLEFHVADNQVEDNIGGVSLELARIASCVSPPAGVTHWYPGDTDGNDFGPGMMPGTLESGVTVNAAGKVAGAFQFDGVNGGVNLGNLPACDFTPDSSFTIDAWINSFGPTTQEAQFILTLNYHESLTVQWMAIGNAGPAAGKLTFAVRDANGALSSVLSPAALSSNVFHHVAGVREVTGMGKTLKLYVDGVLVDQAPDVTTGALALAADDYIGRRWPWLDNSTFNGLIDELAIYNRALSDCEVASLYKAGGAGKCKSGQGLAADLAVTVLASPDPVAAGADLTYGITVTNAGPDPAMSVTLTDPLPQGAAFVSASNGCGEAGGVVTCNLGTLNAGAEANATVVVRPAMPGELTNRVRVAAVEADLDCADDEAVATTTVSGGATATPALTATTTPTPVPTATPAGTHDMAVIGLKVPKNVNLKAAAPALTKRVKVQIQNRSPHPETIESLATLADLVSVTLSNLKTGCTPPLARQIQGRPNVVPKTLKPKGKLNVFFDVTFDTDCLPDAMKSKKSDPNHEDFSYTARVEHMAFVDGSPDTHPACDICPRGPLPGGVDPNPDPAHPIKDKGCGGKNPDRTLGAPVTTDLVLKP